MENDLELFNSAITDEPVENGAVDSAETTDDVNRDEQGRFAAKAEDEPAAAAPVKDEANVPSWRLREVNDLREAAERRAADVERRFNELQSKLPKPETAAAPDVFENPNGFLEHGVRQAVDPIKNEMVQLREFYSRREAIREHGQEKVNAAYQAVAQGMQSRDPEVAAVYQRAMSSMDPFGEIMSWHQQKTVFQQIGNDPNAWFEKQLEERAKDPAFLEKLKAFSPAPQTQGSVFKLPPSMNRVASAAAPQAQGGDMSDAELFTAAVSARR